MFGNINAKARRLGIIDCGETDISVKPGRSVASFYVHPLCQRRLRIYRTEDGEIGEWCARCVTITSREQSGLAATESLNNLIAKTGSKTADELIKYALLVVSWCVEKTEEGKLVGCIEREEETGEYKVCEVLKLPWQKGDAQD